MIPHAASPYCPRPRQEAPPRLSPLLFWLLSPLYLLCFLYIPHSLAQWALRNSFAFKRFRTLSIATGVYAPFEVQK